ncbi:MAG TPA: holo-ACP synthase [Actinomycetota bacterium]|nr:holo-ACP synthase [Actinomycetota bacterium]
MEVLGLGVDLVDVERVEAILARRKTFRQRVFTPEEIEYCESQGSPAACYAARWAAREACRKALGGVSEMGWKDVSVRREASGPPRLTLRGSSKRRAGELGVSEVLVTLTHERRMAAAFCLAVRS